MSWTVLGVDVSTKAVDLVELDGGGGWCPHTLELLAKTDISQARRMARTLEVVEEWALHHRGRYTIVYVERPTGKHPSPLLTMTAGVVALGLERVLGDGNVHLVPITQWKLRAIGKGNASKEGVMAWARERYGYEGDRQDTADALGIAAAAAHDLRRAPHAC